MRKTILVGFVLAVSVFLTDLAYAQRGTRGLSKVLTKAAKVGDNVAIRGVDDIAQVMSGNKAAREAMQRSVHRITRSSGPDAVKKALCSTKRQRCRSGEA